MNAPERKPRGKKNKARAEWTLRAGQTQGEVALGFHNSSGKLSDEISRKNWIDALLAKLDIVGVCELGADASVQAEMEAAQWQLRDGYKVVFGRGTRFNFEEGDGTQSLTRMRRCLTAIEVIEPLTSRSTNVAHALASGTSPGSAGVCEYLGERGEGKRHGEHGARQAREQKSSREQHCSAEQQSSRGEQRSQQR